MMKWQVKSKNESLLRLGIKRDKKNLKKNKREMSHSVIITIKFQGLRTTKSLLVIARSKLLTENQLYNTIQTNRKNKGKKQKLQKEHRLTKSFRITFGSKSRSRMRSSQIQRKRKPLILLCHLMTAFQRNLRLMKKHFTRSSTLCLNETAFGVKRSQFQRQEILILTLKR